MIHATTKVCELCGKLFTTTSIRRKICYDTHYRKCECCGNLFMIRDFGDKRKCCSRSCTELMKKQRREATMIERYGVPYALQSEIFQDKLKETNLERYGVEHAAQSEDIKKKTKRFFEAKYGVTTPFKMQDFQEKASKTCLDKYGVKFQSQIPERIVKAVETCYDKYGGPCPLSDEELRRKAARNQKTKSSLELRLHQFLDNLHIDYVEEYVIKSDAFTHSFDLFLPKYNILIDCDGLFYHGYQDDSDGRWVNEDYDALRLTCISQGCRFLKIVESDVEHGLVQLKHMLTQIDSRLLDYESDIFKWCRSIEFPYPDYTEKRLKREWNRLCQLSEADYTTRCNIGISLVNQFHKSIWTSHVKNLPSPYDAWNDDLLLKKCIVNRTIYQDDVNPSKVLQGFSVSKIAPKVSVFRPALAKYLILKYLKNSDAIRDPFSGFSGRMLGAVAADKRYIGSDIRMETVSEAKNLRKFLGMSDDSCKLFQQDLVCSPVESDIDAVFTCPPYSDKEQWVENYDDTRTCDDWIDLCLVKYSSCHQFLFVVDKTTKYESNVVEQLSDASHFRKSKENVILISR